jgi:very-short-patch-repair endonuclease
MKEVIKSTARKLRKDQTEAEKILWNKLRNRDFLGFKFIRQHPIVFEIEGEKRFFIADFFCHQKNLVIEIDGGIHRQQKEYDQFRDLIIKNLGLRVIRVTNGSIEEDSESFLESVLAPILKA